MNKEEALNEFLKGLRIVLNNACAYYKEHPYFVKSVEVFKQKLDLLLRFYSPVRIDITPNSLFLDGKHWQKPAMYAELASMLHLRKLKSIEFRQGVTLGELVDFLSCVSQPTKEILRRGGLQNILNKEKSAHVYIEDLDYSQLLYDEGEETKDIWAYLFKQAVERNNQKEIDAFADNFGKIIGKFKTKELFEDQDLRQNLQNFLSYLKEHQKEKFFKCSREMLKSALKFKENTTGKNIDNVKAFFKDFNEDEFAYLLWNEMSTEENFDIFSFRLFSQLTDEEKHKKIASSLLDKASESDSLKHNKKAVKNIQNLLMTPDIQVISEVYRNTLTTLLSRVSFDEGLSFEAEVLRMNYRFTLFNLFEREKKRENLNLILEPISKECNNIIKERKLEHLRFITDIIDKKTKEDASISNMFEGLEKSISDFIENGSFEEEVLPGLGYFIDRTKKIYQRLDFYFERIFNEGRMNPTILQLLFKFFPQDLPYFYEHLQKRHSDIDFLVKVIKSLENIDTDSSLETLKKIFYFSNNIVKIEVIKSMQNLTKLDEEFLFSVLKGKELLLKREAVLILVKQEETRNRVFRELLSIPSPLGRKNKLILENITLIENLNYPDALVYLEALLARPFFWNKNIRDKAKQVLNKLKC